MRPNGQAQGGVDDCPYCWITPHNERKVTSGVLRAKEGEVEQTGFSLSRPGAAG